MDLTEWPWESILGTFVRPATVPVPLRACPLHHLCELEAGGCRGIRTALVLLMLSAADQAPLY